jgi:hypothetical protein
VATTSNGPSRRPSLALAGAVVLVATALVRLTEEPARTVGHSRPHATPAAPRTTSAIGPPVLPVSEPGIDTRSLLQTADDLERDLAEAAPGTADRVLEQGLVAWLRHDAAGAAAFAMRQTEPFLREVALRTVAQHWAAADVPAAAAWAESLVDAGERDRAIEQVALSIADTRPRAALDLLARRSGDPPRDAASVGVVTSWARGDFDAALAWTEAQPSGPTRDDIVERLVLLDTGQDPEASLSLADRLVTDEGIRRDAWAAVSRRWAAREPGRVRAWAAATDDGTRRRVEAELANAAN